MKKIIHLRQPFFIGPFLKSWPIESTLNKILKSNQWTVTRNLRYDEYEEDCVEDQQKATSRHHQHSSWIKLPPGPLFRVMTYECRECFVSPLILFPEPFRSVPSILNTNDAQNSLNHEINAQHPEPGLCKQILIVIWLIRCELLRCFYFLYFYLSLYLLKVLDL